MFLYKYPQISFIDYHKSFSYLIHTFFCPFRCVYCYNAKLVLGKVEKANEKEILKKVFDYIDLTKNDIAWIVISGGEPCLWNKKLVKFLNTIKRYNDNVKIKLDTNGYYPDVLNILIKDKLIDYIAMDVKFRIDKEGQKIYKKIIQKNNIDFRRILKSIDLIKDSRIEHEFRCVKLPFFKEKDIEILKQQVPGVKINKYVENKKEQLFFKNIEI